MQFFQFLDSLAWRFGDSQVVPREQKILQMLGCLVTLLWTWPVRIQWAQMDWEKNKQDLHGVSLLYPQDDTKLEGADIDDNSVVEDWFYTATKQLYSSQLYPKEDEGESSMAPWDEGGEWETLLCSSLLQVGEVKREIALWHFFTGLYLPGPWEDYKVLHTEAWVRLHVRLYCVAHVDPHVVVIVPW